LEIGITARQFLKLYHVFNVSQTEGLPEHVITPQCKGLTDIEKHAAADEIITAAGAKIVHIAGNSAHYNPEIDKIQMPMRKQFKNKGHYYGVLFHELVHWTRHAKRLNRKFDETVENDYAFEELVAELGRTFLCAELGIAAPLKSNAAYIKSWLGALRNDRNYLLKAVSYADRAVQYLSKKQSITTE
jgi:antirestriction protein ArdC